MIWPTLQSPNLLALDTACKCLDIPYSNPRPLYGTVVAYQARYFSGSNIAFKTEEYLYLAVTIASNKKPLPVRLAKEVEKEFSLHEHRDLCLLNCDADFDSFCFSITAGVALPARSLRHYRTLIALTLSAGRSPRLAVPALVRGELVSTMDALKQIFAAIAKEVLLVAQERKTKTCSHEF